MDDKNNRSNTTDVRQDDMDRDSATKGNNGHVISEAEAKMLLMEETRKTHQKLNDANKKNKKLLAIVIVVAIVICVAGVGIAVILGGNKGNNDQTQSSGSTDQSQVDTSKPEEKPDEPTDDGMTDISLEDERVHVLYDNFGILSSADMFSFYSDPTAFSGFLNNKYLIGVAFGNIERQTCKMPSTSEELTKRYAEQMAQGLSTEVEAAYGLGCYSGEDLRTKAQEIFGRTVNLEGVEFPVLGWQYSPEYDEIYAVPNVGSDGFGPGKGYIRGLYGAKQDKDGDIYLYEVVAETSGSGLICAKTGTYCEEEYDPTLENIAAHREDFNQYKWYFAKQIDGNYVFEKIEKIN